MTPRLLPVLALLTACSAELVAPTDEAIGASVTATFTHDGETVHVAATRVAPDTSWLRMYREAAKCAGLRGDPAGVRWFTLSQQVVFPDGTNWFGAYDARARSIFLVAGDTLSIRHEALHDVLWRTRREQGHPRPPFGVCDVVENAPGPGYTLGHDADRPAGVHPGSL